MPRHPDAYRALLADNTHVQTRILEATEELRQALHDLGLSFAVLAQLDLAGLLELYLVLADWSARAQAVRPMAEIPLRPEDLVVLETVLASSRAAGPMMHQAGQVLDLIRALVPDLPDPEATQYQPPPPAHRTGENPVIP